MGCRHYGKGPRQTIIGIHTPPFPTKNQESFSVYGLYRFGIEHLVPVEDFRDYMGILF